MHTSVLLVVAGILFLGMLCQWFAWRVKLPSILFLLLAGVVAGPVTGWIDPDQVFGDLLFPFVSLSVAIILFEGGLTLRFSDLRGHGAVVRNLVTVGCLITWVVAGLAAYWILDFDPYLASLFGAIVVVSGPTVITPLLRTVRPSERLAHVLRWEGILIDPLGALLVLLVFDFLVEVQTGAAIGQVLRTVFATGLVGAGLGALLGQVFGVTLRRHWLPDYLRDVAALSLVVLVFAVAETLQHESGLLAVTVMGIWLANMRHVELEDILDFKESLSLLLISSLFVILAARLDLGNLKRLGMGALAVLLVLQFVGGPLRALVCSWGSPLSWRERCVLAWVFPRGIVAAAVSSLFALRLEEAGQSGAEALVPLVFVVIIGTVVMQGFTAGPLARWLGVAEPESRGVLLVGANPVSLAMAEAIQAAGHRVLVADSSWASIQQARMQGVPTFFGSVVSAYADRHLDLIGLGKLVALSDQANVNELAAVRYQAEFGRDSVFVLKTGTEAQAHLKHQVSGSLSARLWPDPETTYDDLDRRLNEGDVIRTTLLTDAFDLEAYLARYADALILFAADKEGNLRFPTATLGLTPKAAWKVTALLSPDPVSGHSTLRTVEERG